MKQVRNYKSSGRFHPKTHDDHFLSFPMHVKPQIIKLASFWIAFTAMLIVHSHAVSADDHAVWNPVNNRADCVFLNQINQSKYDAQWTGMCRNGFVQGQGSITYDTELGETSVTGTFKDGILDGHGEMVVWVARDGARHKTLYTGEFKNSLFDGHGVIVLSDSTVYEGEFKNAMPNGYGVLKIGDHIKIEGTFQSSSLEELQVTGNGVMEVEGDTGYRYTGPFKDMLKHGDGIQVYANGTRYEGTFNDDWRHGQGTVTLPGGDTCEGEWKNGRLIGYGKGILNGHSTSCFMDKTYTFVFITQP